MKYNLMCKDLIDNSIPPEGVNVIYFKRLLYRKKDHSTIQPYRYV